MGETQTPPSIPPASNAQQIYFSQGGSAGTDPAVAQPRVGILTLHYGLNYGAILQSLSSASLFGGVIVDHRYVAKEAAYKSSAARDGHLQDFIDRRLPLSSRTFRVQDDEHADTWRYIDSCFDLLICGSDELWKVDYGTLPTLRRTVSSYLRSPLKAFRNGTRGQPNRYATPFPNVYWPRVKVPAVGFAASVGETRLSEIPSAARRAMRACLQEFRLIGVRDSRSELMISKLLNGSGPCVRMVPDPVFAYTPATDAASEAEAVVREKLCAVGVDPDSDFVATNILRPTRYGEQVEQELSTIDMPAVEITTLGLSPPEWFAAFKLARYAIVDAMHPLIVCLCHNTPCLSLDPRQKSVELRRHFNISHDTLKHTVERWPEAIPGAVDECRRAVHDFVRLALREARSHVV